MLHLSRFDAVLFDLDGVLTDTARVHETAWAAIFTELFERVRTASGTPAGPPPFTDADYRRLVDGEARLEGVHHVLADRGIVLPEGGPDDQPGLDSAWAVAKAKDLRYRELLGTVGARPFASSLAMVQDLRAAGLLLAVVSASRHCLEVLAAAGMSGLFDSAIDGRVAAAMGLAGKPDPATYLEAAARLGVDPDRAVVVEDALSGVEAGRNGGFGLVVGVDRLGTPGALRDAGADVVVADLAELRLDAGRRGPWHVELSDDSGAAAGGSAEGRWEALGTLANGYVGTRGAWLGATDDGTHYPGTYLAGVYDRLTSPVDGAPVEREAVVNAPNWLPLTYSVNGGPWLGDGAVEVSFHRLHLDLRRGLLVRRWRTVDPEGRCSSVVERRLVSMADPHLVAVELSVVAENWSGELRVRSGLDAHVANHQTIEEHLLANRHLGTVTVGEDPPEVCWLTARTMQSGITLAEAARTRLTAGTETARQPVSGDASVAQELSVHVLEGGRVGVEKVVAIFTSRDRAISDPETAARPAAAAAGDFKALLGEHAAAWARLWRRSRLQAEVSESASVSSGTVAAGVDANRWVNSGRVHLQLFHLLQVASPHVVELDVGIPARGLGGEGYLGHVFWDELFVLPVLNFRFPEVARAFLRYRCRRLGAARRAAAAAGHRGAMYPWQSGSDGRDETPHTLYNPRAGRWIADGSSRQRHVGLAIAYELWQHWQTTGDTWFFFGAGAEVFLEIARFFADLATFDPALSRWRIRGVMGPDEFHDAYPSGAELGIDDNAYTNVMTAWLLRRARELVELIRRDHRNDVLERIRLSDGELNRWERLAAELYVPFHEGVISQFAGYERLSPIDLDGYRARYGNIGRLDLILDAEGDAVRRYQVAKQADVLMLFYLLSAEELRDVFEGLGYELTPGTIRGTVDYYAARVAHGSTLSAVVHAWVTARADRAGSWAQFREALSTDIADIQGGTTAEGIHLGAMAGTLDLLQRCYTGLEVREDALWLNPALPDELERLRFALNYRDHWVDIDVDHHRLAVGAAAGQALPATLVLRGERRTLEPGQRIERELV
ncbi:MAG: HAD-IA family hydrolase [Candidatus Dormibacteria bacterium]